MALGFLDHVKALSLTDLEEVPPDEGYGPE